jgi:hypothetical protein
LPIVWQVSARTDPGSPLAQWSAYFTRDVPGEVLVDFLIALDARDQLGAVRGDSEMVLDAVGNGWPRHPDEATAGVSDPAFASYLIFGEVSPLVQDADPQTEVGEAGPAGWQAWSGPVPGAGYLWAASFSSDVPHDLVAAFAGSLSSSAPVLRRVLPEATQERLLRPGLHP